MTTSKQKKTMAWMIKQAEQIDAIFEREKMSPDECLRYVAKLINAATHAVAIFSNNGNEVQVRKIKGVGHVSPDKVTSTIAVIPCCDEENAAYLAELFGEGDIREQMLQ